MYRVDEAICTGCGDCLDACPAGALSLVDGRARIDDATCADCGSCAAVCPQGAIVMADAADRAHALVGPEANAGMLKPVAVSTKVTSVVQRPELEPLAAAPRRSRFWPAVGAALVWAARELLPEVMAAWRTARAADVQPTRRTSVTLGQAAVRRPRAGHRHRWGRGLA